MKKLETIAAADLNLRDFVLTVPKNGNIDEVVLHHKEYPNQEYSLVLVPKKKTTLEAGRDFFVNGWVNLQRNTKKILLSFVYSSIFWFIGMLFLGPLIMGVVIPWMGGKIPLLGEYLVMFTEWIKEAPFYLSDVAHAVEVGIIGLLQIVYISHKLGQGIASVLVGWIPLVGQILKGFDIIWIIIGAVIWFLFNILAFPAAIYLAEWSLDLGILLGWL